jgi:hypothetical protein
MLGDLTRAAIAVVRPQRPLVSSVARLALRERWPVYSLHEPGLVRTLVRSGARVVIVQFDDACGPSEDLISRLGSHYSPVACVAMGTGTGGSAMQGELAARRAGAAAYIDAGAGEGLLMQAVQELDRAASVKAGARANARVA